MNTTLNPDPLVLSRKAPGSFHPFGHRPVCPGERNRNDQPALSGGRRPPEDAQLRHQRRGLPGEHPHVRRTRGRVEPLSLHRGRGERPVRRAALPHGVPQSLRRDSRRGHPVQLLHEGRRTARHGSRADPPPCARGAAARDRAGLSRDGRAGVLRRLAETGSFFWLPTSGATTNRRPSTRAPRSVRRP